MSYFDNPLHSTGALTTALSTHASAVQGVSTADIVCITSFISISYNFLGDYREARALVGRGLRHILL